MLFMTINKGYKRSVAIETQGTKLRKGCESWVGRESSYGRIVGFLGIRIDGLHGLRGSSEESEIVKCAVSGRDLKHYVASFHTTYLNHSLIRFFSRTSWSSSCCAAWKERLIYGLVKDYQAQQVAIRHGSQKCGLTRLQSEELYPQCWLEGNVTI